MSEHPPTLDADLTRELTEEAIAEVDANASEYWKDIAYGAACEAAAIHLTFIADQVWEILDSWEDVPRVHNKSAMGPVFRRLIADGIIAAEGTFQRSIRPATHGKPLPVWRSLILCSSLSTK